MTTTTTITTEEKYRVLAPESMQETFMSDSEDEGGKFIEYIVYTLKFIEHIGYTKFIEYVAFIFLFPDGWTIPVVPVPVVDISKTNKNQTKIKPKSNYLMRQKYGSSCIFII